MNDVKKYERQFVKLMECLKSKKLKLYKSDKRIISRAK